MVVKYQVNCVKTLTMHRRNHDISRLKLPQVWDLCEIWKRYLLRRGELHVQT